VTTATAPSLERLSALAFQAVERARAAGADEAEGYIETSRSFRVVIQNGKVETLSQSATNGLGIRVLVGGALGFVSTTDLRFDTVSDLTRRAVALARHSTQDEANAFAEPDDDPVELDALGLYDPAVPDWPPEQRIARARAIERAVLAADARITRTDGATVHVQDGATALANSRGVARAWRETAVSAWAVALADDRDGKQQTGVYGAAHRRLEELPDPETLAREAARRAIARIGARSVASARVPVVLDPDVAGSWIAEMHDAFSGESVIQRSSWLTDRLHQTIGSPLVTLIDDGRRPGGIATAPFDGEGVPTRRNVLVDAGRCAMFEYDVYHARRAGTRSTGSAVRGYSSTPRTGPHNLYLAPGGDTPEAILARVDRGFYMDDQGSYGFNPVTGDYSYQAQGFWIEHGTKTFPVEGVTVAGNSLDMLRQVVAVGNDLEWRTSVSAPTVLIAEMTVSGGG
jgi:PmbA protein